MAKLRCKRKGCGVASMCTAFGSVACLITWIILMSVVGALAPSIYSPPSANGDEVRTDKPPFNYTLPTKNNLSPYCDTDDYYVYCLWPAVEVPAFSSFNFTSDKTHLEELSISYNLETVYCSIGWLDFTLLSLMEEQEYYYYYWSTGCVPDYMYCYLDIEEFILDLEVLDDGGRCHLIPIPAGAWIASFIVTSFFFLAFMVMSISHMHECYFETDERIPLGINSASAASSTSNIGTFNSFVGYWFLGMFMPFVSALPMACADPPALHKLGAWLGTLAMTQALGLSFAVLFWDYTLYYLLAMTLFSGLVALGIAFWWKYSFLPVYDKSTSEHFELLPQDSSPESWGQPLSTSLWFLCGLLLPATGTFFCICFAPLKGRWACWMGTAIAGMFHIFVCNLIPPLTSSGNIDLAGYVYCLDAWYAGGFEALMCLGAASFSSVYYYLRMRPTLIGSSEEKSQPLSTHNTSFNFSTLDSDDLASY